MLKVWKMYLGEVDCNLPSDDSPRLCLWMFNNGLLRSFNIFAVIRQFYNDDDMPAEINFSHAIRGKFYQPNLILHIPVYLDKEVQDYLTGIAIRKGIQVSEVANDLLKREIQIIEAVK